MGLTFAEISEKNERKKEIEENKLISIGKEYCGGKEYYGGWKRNNKITLGRWKRKNL